MKGGILTRILFTACALPAFLFGLLTLTPTAKAESTLEKRKVVYGGSSWLGHYPAWIGIKKGFFKQAGLEVRFESFFTSSGRMASLVAGNVDLASTGSISAIALMATGVKSFYALGTQDSFATV